MDAKDFLDSVLSKSNIRHMENVKFIEMEFFKEKSDLELINLGQSIL